MLDLRIASFRSAILLVALFLLGGCAASQETAVVVERAETPVPSPAPEQPVAAVDTTALVVEPGRFDTGRMWTFDAPPTEYFAEQYGFRPDSAWFARARLGALRIPGCSASFVSPNGLVVTNHHCARDAIASVSRAGEELVDEGFYAESLEEERRAEEMYAEQLIAIRDVTQRVRSAGASAEARQQRAKSLEEQLTAEAKRQDTTFTVQVIELYSGGRYAAYTFRKFNDVRLVLAPELEIGSFGGDPDNFTYPRYSLDFTFFRVYDVDGEPYEPEVHFPWARESAEAGDLVFVVGNPGTTNRLNTIAQLLYDRDVDLPQQLELFRDRAARIDSFLQANPDVENAAEIRNTLLSLRNEIKRAEGELAGLEDPMLIARRRAAEEQLRAEIAGVDSLQQAYGGAYEQLAEIQVSKRAMSRQNAAFKYFLADIVDSHVLFRAVHLYLIDLLKQRGAPQSTLDDLREAALEVETWPAALETSFLAARLADLREHLGPNDPTVGSLLGGRAPEEVAQSIVENTALIDSAGTARLLESGFLGSGDPTVRLAEALTPLFFSLNDQLTGLQNREEELNAELALARFALRGANVPPDASFSLRISDGVVAGYPYNGTIAPPHTTLYGLYDHYFSYGGEGTDWDLPDEWLEPPEGFDLSRPANLVSTNDITGGNSGSPLLSRDLELVGIAFDSNMEALPNTYLFRDERGRAISVDALGVLEVVDEMYDADRIVLELTEGVLVPSDAAAEESLDGAATGR